MNAYTQAGHHRVAVTGRGIITSLGCGWRENAAGFRQGRVALPRITLFDASRMRVDRAGEVAIPATLPSNLLPERLATRVDRGAALLLHAALEAWQSAGLDLGAWRNRRVPISLGTSAGAMAIGEAYYKQAVNQPGNRRGQATRVQQYQIQSQALLVAAALGLEGPVTIIANACASGANSIGHAFEQLRHGRAQTAVAGGYDALCEMVFAGFDSLQALTTDTPRPFDANRDGLALGEGAGVFILETFEHALAREANILAEVCGYGAATDLHHLTQPHPQGDAAIRSMTEACRVANLQPQDIAYINSHGTGTPLNDVAEANAIVRWAGEGTAERIAVSSTKASIGHLLGGAGSVEAVICLMALREGWLPPTTTIRTLDPACRFDVVQAPRSADLRHVLTNSFGFGGANATVILGRVELGVSCSAKLAKKPPVDVCISGLGAVSPAGWGVAALMQAVDGQAELPVTRQTRAEGAMAVSVRAVPAPTAPPAFLRDPRLRRVSPISRYAVSAALEALGAERLALAKAGKLRVGVLFSIQNGCVNYSRRFFAEVLADPKTASPILFPETVFNAPASHLSALLGSAEVNYTVVSDHAGFLPAVEVAAQWLEEDRVDGVLVVAAEELDWLSSEAATLLDPSLVLAEGGAAVYLERHSMGGAVLDGSIQHVLVTPQRNRVDAARTLAESEIGQADCGVLLCDGLTGSLRSDAAESAAWAAWTGPRISPRRALGEGMGVSAGWQMVCAASALLSGRSSSALISTVGNNEQAALCRLRRG